MTIDLTTHRARSARIAVSVMFVSNGAISASIIPRLPAIKEGLGLSNGELGAAVAAMPIGGLLAGGLVGFLVARFGSRWVAVVAGALAAITLAAVGLATSWASLALAYLVLGMFDAIMDASMNVHGIGLQRRYGRSILQGFHGTWSLGSMAAGAIGAVAAWAGIPVAVHLALAAVVILAAVGGAGRWFLPASIADAAPDDGAVPVPIQLRTAPRLLRILVPIAMLGILCSVLQSSAATWGAVYLADVLLQPAGIAASAFVVYMAAMVVGRLTNDRWVDRWGPTAVVRVGAAIGVLSVGAVMAAAPLGLVPLALLGFAGIGLGSSPMFPVMVGTAGSQPGIPAGHGIAIATWLVKIGLVFAPAMIGAAADIWGLAAALGISLVAAAALGIAAPLLTRTRATREMVSGSSAA